ISLYGPPLAWPGFRSKVSICEGPPLIHSRMHAFLRAGWAAAAWAKDSNQPETQGARTPAADSFSQSRRGRSGVDMRWSLHSYRGLVVTPQAQGLQPLGFAALVADPGRVDQ